LFSKHMRRAAHAALTISILAALLLGGTAQAAKQKPAALPTVTIGTKNFTEQYVLGQLYKQALESKGYKVVFKEDIGNSELIDTALQSGKINFYPEYTGVIVADLAKKPAPKTAAAAYAAAKKFEESRGNTVLAKTPFFDSDSFGMLTSTAKKLGVKTIADMKKVKSFSFGGFPECRTRMTCLLGLKKIYGLTQTKFVPLVSISVYTALDQRKITSGDVFSTDPQLSGNKYTVLTDTKHVFGFQNVVPVISKKLAKDGGAKLAATINAVSAKLSQKAMIAMNKAVAIDKKSPETVASAFLTANKLK
jgi:osmoprotectant transport system substrate-binding protein